MGDVCPAIVGRRNCIGEGALAHEGGLPAVDALILAGFVQAGVGIIYTTDKHLEAYKVKGVQMVNLAKVTRNQ